MSAKTSLPPIRLKPTIHKKLQEAWTKQVQFCNHLQNLYTQTNDVAIGGAFRCNTKVCLRVKLYE